MRIFTTATSRRIRTNTSQFAQTAGEGRIDGSGPFRGHTLMEALLVMGMLALLVAMVVPNLFGRIDRTVFDEDVGQFVHTLRVTADEAMFRGKTLVVLLDVTDGYYTVYEKTFDNLYKDAEPLIERQGLDFSYIQVVEYTDGSQQFSGEMMLIATPEGWAESYLFEIIDLSERLKWVRVDAMTTRASQSDQRLDMPEVLSDVSIYSSL